MEPLIDLNNDGNYISESDALETIWSCKDPQKLDRYVYHEDFRVLVALATYTNIASIDSYIFLANHENKTLLECLTNNVYLPIEVHLYIWKDNIYSPIKRFNVLENILVANLVPAEEVVNALHTYMNLYEEKDDDIIDMLSLLGTSPHVSRDDLNRLLTYNKSVIIDSIIWNKNLDFTSVISIANSGDNNAQEAALDRRHELIKYLQQIAGNELDYNSLNEDWVRNLLGWKL